MSGQEYPGTFKEFQERFATEEACLAYIRQLRWPNGFVCPRCGSQKAWPRTRGLLECSGCGFQASVTAGTIFHGTRKPLKLWFDVMWWVVSQKTGASAMNLRSAMGFGSYETAWTWLHKLRRGMIRPGRDKLQGTVEVDETTIGGDEPGTRGRERESRSLVAVAVEGKAPDIGRVRFECIFDASAENLIPFVEDYVERGAVVRTDGWAGYASLRAHGYRHQVIDAGRGPSKVMPNVHLVVSLLKRWLLGTHQGAVSAKHLPYYLDEFAFRFNRRLSTHRGKLFYRLMQQAVTVQGATYEDIVHGDF